jgi:biotin synthase
MEKQAFNQTKNLVLKARVHTSAGRLKIGREAQTLAFLAGAKSIFTGDKLLTMPNPGTSEDHLLIAALGLKARAPEKKDEEGCRYENLRA